MEKIKVLVVADSEEKRFEIKNALKSDDIAIVAYSKPGAAVLEKAGSLMPDVAVMFYDNESNDVSEVAERIFMNLPGCSVLLLCEDMDIKLIEKAMEAGVRKILQWPTDSKTLLENINLLHSAEKMRMTNFSYPNVKWQSQVVSIFGTKGGIGKTTIAINLAVALSRSGKKVALIDLDLQFGDIGVFLDLEPKDTIAELIQEKNSYDIDTIKSYMVLHSSGVSVLCAPKTPEYSDMITGEHIDKIINTLRPYYDYVIVDSPTTFNECSLMAIEDSNLVLFVITLDISTLRNARISMDVFESLNQKDKIKVVENRVIDGIITTQDAQRILGAEVYFRIRSDWKTAIAALNKGIPIVIDMPRSPLGQQLIKLANVVSTTKT